MGIDDDDYACNTGLFLGLGFSSTPSKVNNQTTPKKSSMGFELLPSLTLGLSGDCQASSPQADHSVVSNSFSSGRSVKREREFSSDKVEEVDKSFSRVSTEEDEDGVNSRKKLRLTKQQSDLLEESFKLHTTLNPKQKQGLAKQLNLRPRQVEVWFQNRRARTKLKQTEMDCELLKKCCEKLTDENRKLEKEVQELKAMKVAQPLYMHMPAATVTMCPCCERIGGVGDGNSKNPFSVLASKPLFYNPFTNPSAAC